VIRWVSPQYLYLLMLVPLMILGVILYVLRRKSRLRFFADEKIIPKITASVSTRLQLLKPVLLITGFALLVVALARPKWGERLQIYEGKGIDIVIALDASKSMLAQDVKPNRLDRAKTEIKLLLDDLSGNRVGITAFAGECYIMCPLTADIEAAKLFLDVISPDVVPKPGTNLEKAIAVSSSLFDPKEDTYKALILFTDGDNLVGEPVRAIDDLKDRGVKLFTVGIGTVEGAPVPEFDQQGNFVSYKKDKDDKIVMSRLSERLLIILTKATDGRYFRTEGVYMDKLISELDKIRKKDISGGEYIEYEERYQYFLVPAFLFMLSGVFISDRKGRWLQWTR
jgi:Ca-activated chloride channel family protein